MLTVERLRVLAELSRRRTLAAVADALSYSTSAVSQQLRHLEKDVGVPLVERVGRGLVLTAQGELLAARAQTILADVERAEADVLASVGHPRGTVTVAAFQSAALTLVPAAVADLRERHPEVHVHFELGETDETLAALPGAGVDLVIAERYPGELRPPAPGLAVVPLLEDPLWIAVDARLGESLDPSRDLLAQLADAAWASEPEGTPPRTWLTEQCRRRGFAPRVTCVSEDLAVQAAFVASGHAVAVLPGLALAASSGTAWSPESANSVGSDGSTSAGESASSTQSAGSTGSATSPLVGAASGIGNDRIWVFPLEEPAPIRQVVAAWPESAGEHGAARAILESLRRVAHEL